MTQKKRYVSPCIQRMALKGGLSLLSVSDPSYTYPPENPGVLDDNIEDTGITSSLKGTIEGQGGSSDWIDGNSDNDWNTGFGY